MCTNDSYQDITVDLKKRNIKENVYHIYHVIVVSLNEK